MDDDDDERADVLAAEALEAMATLVEDFGYMKSDLENLVRDALKLAES